MPMARLAYATMALQASDATLRAALCMQTRLHTLGAKFPLVLVHDASTAASPLGRALLPRFDRSALVPWVRFVDRRRATGRRLMQNGQQELMLMKLHVLNMTSYRRLLYMDADIYVRALPDALLAAPMSAALAAVPVGERCFNAGLLLVRPSAGAFALARVTARRHVWHRPICEFYRTDQTVLNLAFPRFARLPARWNWCRRFSRRAPVRVPAGYNVHFVGPRKPPDMCDPFAHSRVASNSSAAPRR